MRGKKHHLWAFKSTPYYLLFTDNSMDGKIQVFPFLSLLHLIKCNFSTEVNKLN